MKQTLHCVLFLLLITSGFSEIKAQEVPAELISQEKKSDIQISPNPFEDIVTIDVAPNTQISEIKIFDLVGKQVAKINLKGVLKTEVNLSHIKPGVYFVTVYTDKGIVETRKLYRSK